MFRVWAVPTLESSVWEMSSQGYSIIKPPPLTGAVLLVDAVTRLRGLCWNIWRQSINRLDYRVHRQAGGGTGMDLLEDAADLESVCDGGLKEPVSR